MTALLKEARTLKPRQRVALVNRLLALDLADDAVKVDEAEIVRRVEEVRLGQARLLDVDDMMQAAHALAGLPGKAPRLKASRR